ncbi:MAG: DUF945 family protein, partial [Emcibacteraceae bacterium]|nr:DUF945 family protein [Emcibacteraceae bacterium]
KATINFNEPFSLNDQNLKELLDLSANVGLSEAFVNDIMKITSQRNPQMATMTSEQRIQMVKTQLTQLIQQGLLIEQKDDYYTADIGTKNNFITINGKPIFPLITPPAP